MHESGIVRSLVARAETIVQDAGIASADRIGIHLGALSGIDPEVVRSHWRRLATGSTRTAALDIVIEDDPTAAGALGATLAYVEVGD